MNNQIFIHGFPPETTDAELRELCGRYGQVLYGHIARDAARNSRGFAFVTLETELEAAHAIVALNGAEWGGRELHVRIAEERPRPGKQLVVNA